MLKPIYIVAIVAACAGVALGSVATSWRCDARAHQARYQNYTDRGRICLEAAALLRANQPIMAQKYLERHADAAIKGVAMWRSFDELSDDDKSLIVTAKLYDRSFADLDFNLHDRIRGEMPDDHPWLSTNIRGIAAKTGR